MSVWAGPDDRQGSNDSLYVLSYLVPVAAEEEAVRDEVRCQRARQEWDFDPCAEDVS